MTSPNMIHMLPSIDLLLITLFWGTIFVWAGWFITTLILELYSSAADFQEHKATRHWH